jgi:hypothetical protein
MVPRIQTITESKNMHELHIHLADLKKSRHSGIRDNSVQPISELTRCTGDICPAAGRHPDSIWCTSLILGLLHHFPLMFSLPFFEFWTGQNFSNRFLRKWRVQSKAMKVIHHHWNRKNPESSTGHSHFEYPFQNMIGWATISADTRGMSNKIA